jgi:hypothetical protein
MTSSLEKTPELVASPATGDETWRDRTARALRRTLDIVSALGLGYALLNDGDAGSAATYLIVMLGVFPHPKIGEYLRLRSDTPWLMISAGVLMALYVLGTALFTVYGSPRNALLGAALALVGWGNLLFVRSPKGAGMSPRRFAVGVTAIALGSLWLVLALS